MAGQPTGEGRQCSAGANGGLWAFAASSASPGARGFYDRRRAAGDTHNRALRALANRLVGILHGCLTHGMPDDEHTACARRTVAAA